MANSGAIADPIYQPAMRVITAITQANPMQVTTSFAHDYVAGEIVTLKVPSVYGMYQADGLRAEILEIVDDSNFTLKIDSTGFDVFSVPADTKVQNAEVLPAGGTSIYTATDNTLPSRNRF